MPETVAAHEALVRVHRVGICGTDLHAYQGSQPFFSYPRRLGHELGVEVIKVGAEVKKIKVGDACAVEPYLTCGKCIACVHGKTNCCVDLKCLGVHVDGGMCEYFTIPAKNLHPSEKLSFDELALVETLGIGAHGVHRAQIRAGERVLIIGAGPIGLSAIQFALAAGAEVIVADINQRRLAFCEQQLGVKHCIDPTSDTLSQLEQLSGSELAPVVIDCTGSKASMESTFQYVSHGGRLVFIGLGKFDIAFHDPHFHRRELSILSSRNSTGAEMRQIIEMIEAGEIDTTPWITQRTNFSQLSSDFPSYFKPETGCIKAMVEVC